MLATDAKLGAMGGATLQAGLVSDPASYAGLARTARSGDAGGLEAAARAFEALLVGQMLKQMRASSIGGGIFDSEQTRLYRDLYDQQLASALSQGEGLGFRKALLRQLAPELSDGAAERRAETLRVPERNPWLLGRLEAAAEGAIEAGATGPVGSAGRAESAEGVPLDRTDGAAAAGRWPPSSPEEFVAYLRPHADEAARRLGMDTSVLLAQSALETGWGRHVPRRADGSSSFNLFGIKADPSWDGDRVSVGTLEYRNGVAQREQAKFRAYASPAESFVDYVAFLRRNPRYREALRADNGEDFIRGLQRAGYATDPSYASKILSIRDRMTRIAPGGAAQVLAVAADTPGEG